MDACSEYEFEVTGTCDNGLQTSATNVNFNTSGCVPNCQSVIGLYDNNIQTSSVILTWDLYAGANGYKLHYRKSGSNWNEYYSSFPMSILFSLDECASYEWYIEVECSPGVFGDPSPLAGFNTDCNAMPDDDDIRLAETPELQFDNIKVYPVPAGDQITVEWPQTIETEVYISVYNSLAELMYTESFTELHQYQIQLNSFPKGVYHLIIQSEKQLISRTFEKL